MRSQLLPSSLTLCALLLASRVGTAPTVGGSLGLKLGDAEGLAALVEVGPGSAAGARR